MFIRYIWTFVRFLFKKHRSCSRLTKYSAIVKLLQLVAESHAISVIDYFEVTQFSSLKEPVKYGRKIKAKVNTVKLHVETFGYF